MKINEAIDRSVRSRHVSTVMECLELKDGLSFGELYKEYCNMCKKEGVEPAVYSTINTLVRRLVYKGFVRKELFVISRGSFTTRFWLVK